MHPTVEYSVDETCPIVVAIRDILISKTGKATLPGPLLRWLNHSRENCASMGLELSRKEGTCHIVAYLLTHPASQPTVTFNDDNEVFQMTRASVLKERLLMPFSAIATRVGAEERVLPAFVRAAFIMQGLTSEAVIDATGTFKYNFSCAIDCIMDEIKTKKPSNTSKNAMSSTTTSSTRNSAHSGRIGVKSQGWRPEAWFHPFHGRNDPPLASMASSSRSRKADTSSTRTNGGISENVVLQYLAAEDAIAELEREIEDGEAKLNQKKGEIENEGVSLDRKKHEIKGRKRELIAIEEEMSWADGKEVMRRKGHPMV
ncbi:hypothetical protein BCR34DRAFT_597291 [Clohesyomyces aquaticus]|uniref:Uncharacterized protein n=1 Tax=Clohesyomyces aquaticus TaxID=1231657 RepID=A0A1Y2A320_9PLEO|nr:hypothetical protein BCR34DRAFT_597291 [Clohesyomyces aquaticus]